MTRPDPTDLSLRDPAKLEALLPRFAFLYDHYFRVEMEGLENISSDQPAIIFGNHCGSSYTLEGAMLATALFRRDGLEHELYVMAHKFFFELPKLRDWLLSAGVVLGNREVAANILRRGARFLVFPGGDKDSHKPFRDRHKVNFFGRGGFIRIAIRERVPLIPFVHVGSHETLFVLSKGERIAKVTGLQKRFGLNVFPLVLSFPFGLTAGAVFPAIPLPAKMSFKIMKPVRPWELGWDDPDNPEHIGEALDYFTREMQRELDVLAKARRWPVLG